MRKYTLTLAPKNKPNYDCCYADDFEVSENGTLTFYKNVESSTTYEFIKMYAHGYWLECSEIEK